MFASIIFISLSFSVNSLPLPQFSISKLPFLVENRELNELIRMKTGYSPFGKALWYHTGSFRDPYNGKVVAGIEGIELIQRVLDERLVSSLNETSKNFTNSILQLASPQKRWMNINNLPYSYTSKKFFVYVKPENRSSGMEKFRKNPVAPYRPVKPATQFSELILFNRPVKLSNNDSISDKKQIRVYESQVYFPSGRKAQGIMKLKETTANNKDENEDSPTSFSPFGRVFGGQQSFTIEHHIRPKQPRSPRSQINKWISFAGSEQGHLHGRSYEIYQLHRRNLWITQPFLNLFNGLFFFQLPRYKVQGRIRSLYRRYGESPAWAAPHRPCEIVMQGYLLNNVKDLPEHVLELVEQYQPDFLRDYQAGEPGLACFAKGKDRLVEEFTPWYKKLFNRK